MATRVFDTLAEWATLDDAALDEGIRLATGKTADATQRATARRLFANALETPGGLKVQTIHAFCTHLLHLFPFEADVAARFEVLDEAATAQILNQLTLDVLLEGATKPDSPLGEALAVYLQAFATNLVQAAIRLGVTGQSGGVQTIAALEPLILKTAARAEYSSLDDLGSACLLSEIAAMKHETQPSRLFRS